MVATPWGDSERVRRRRLSPGPGTAAEEVAENQRRRLYAALVASVAERGYEVTRVADLSAISGVSSRSFYKLFPGGKEECFLIALGQVLDGTVSALSSADDEGRAWEERLREAYERFAEMVAAQPATASFVLAEAYAAGPAAVKVLDRATEAFERLSRQGLSESSERAGLPAAMLQAQVGALQELARTRLRESRPEEMRALVPELVDLVAGYRPPPRPLRRATRTPEFEPDNVASPDEAERALRGFALAVAEHGYAGATIHQIARAGKMSSSTFYANFRDKREALLAAIDSSMAQLEALALAAYRRSPGWAPGIAAAVGSALSFLASRPAMANLLLVEVYAGGPEALRIRARGALGLTRILGEGGPDGSEVPPIASEAIAGGIAALARRQLLRKGAETLPSLAPVGAYIALAPYIGAEEACAAANGNGRAPAPGRADAHRQARAVQRTKWTVLSILASRWASAEVLARELDAPVEEIRRYLEELEVDELVERIAAEDLEGEPEWANRKDFRSYDEEELAALTLEERQARRSYMLRSSMLNLSEGLQQHSFDFRLDEHLTHIPLEVDEQGWKELAQIHRSAYDASEVVKIKSERRLRDSGESGIVARSLQLFFELDAEAPYQAPQDESLQGPEPER